MFLSNINSKTEQKLLTYDIIKKSFLKIKILRLLKKKSLYLKKLKIILIFLFLIKNKLFYINKKVTLNEILTKNKFKNFFHARPVNFVVNINLTYTNTFINVTDIKGHMLTGLSSGSVNLKSKQKIKQPVALLTIAKQILLTSKVSPKSTIALHFKSTKAFHERFIIKLLKQKFFIKTVKSYDFQPHNGCRPKKRKN